MQPPFAPRPLGRITERIWLRAFALRPKFALRANFGYAQDVIRNFGHRFIGEFIITFELSEGGIPGEHWAF
jgi:hypothetical protein